MNHILPSKQNSYGIQSETRQWFKSYLNGRKQRVEVEFQDTSCNTYLNWGIVKHGVTVLGSRLSTISVVCPNHQFSVQSYTPFYETETNNYHSESDNFYNFISDSLASLNEC